jgi:glucokinase
MRNIETIYALGIDVGATKIAGGIVELSDGRVLHSRRVPTLFARGGQAVLDDTRVLAQELMGIAQANTWNIAGIGIGVPELVDLQGNVTSEYSIAWRGVPVQEIFSILAPTVVESDVRAAALGEAQYGAGRAFDIFLYITVGSGISSCLVLRGKPYAGARGNALVLANSPLTTICTNCGAELNPILEDLAAGPALVKRYNQIHPHSAVGGQDVFAAARAGDADAQRILTRAGEALGNSIGFLVNVMDPEAIVVGGGLGLAGELYWESLVHSTRSHIWAETSRDLPILPAALGENAGIIGAAAAVYAKS